MLAKIKAAPLPYTARKARPRLSILLGAQRRGRGAPGQVMPTIHVHGRHMDITADLHARVKERIYKIAESMNGSTVEGEGNAISDADVKIQPSSCNIELHPVHLSPHNHSSFLRNGKMSSLSINASSPEDAFEQAATNLEKKLTPWSKLPPARKVSYRDAFKKK